MSREKQDKEKKMSEKFICHTIAKNISEIVMFSINDEFRNRVFNLLQVSSTCEAQEEIYKKLRISLRNKNVSLDILSSDDSGTEDILNHFQEKAKDHKLKNEQHNSTFSRNKK